MATDVHHRRGHGRLLEGLSIVAGAAHLLPPDAGHKNSSQTGRSSHQQYVGVRTTPGDATPSQLAPRHSASFGPKLVQGDYTYTTSRKSLMVSSQVVGGAGALPPGGGSAALSSPASSTTLAPRGTIPAMASLNAGNINTAAWKAYGSPRTRTQHQRPPLAPGGGGGGGDGAPSSPSGHKLPRVGGFKARRPQSAPGGGSGEGGGEGELGAAIAAIASTVSVGAAARRAGKVPDVVDVGVLAVDLPDPIRAGKTDSGKPMFDYTLPTDPYAKYLWEEQARKARANMTRHVAAMAAAAAVNGGSAFRHSGSGGGSRPGSATRGGGAAATAAVGGGGTGTRPRFSSSTLAEVARQGTDHRPPTVVGCAAPDLTDDMTLPGPNDPRWAYTRLGRTQVKRLQNSLKMVHLGPRTSMRPSSAPTLGGGGGSCGDGATAVASAGVGTDNSSPCIGVGIGSPERSLMRAELSVLDPFADPTQGGAAATFALGSGGGGRPSDLDAQRSSPVAMLRTASGSGGTRPGSATYGRTARAGSPSLPRPGSAGLVRQGSASVMRAGSSSYTGAVGTAVGLALEASVAAPPPPAVPPVRGASAGRTREAAPNPRVDLRAYLAEAEADAEEDDEGTEMLPVGDLAAAAAASGGLLYDGTGGGTVLVDGVPVPVPAEVLQSMPVPADQLAVRLAEMVAAVAVVAAQQQIDGEAAATAVADDNRPRVEIQEIIGDGGQDMAPTPMTPTEESLPPTPPPEPSPPRRFDRPDGDDALAALHGNTSSFGRGPGRFSGNAVDYAASRSGQYGSGGGGTVVEWGAERATPPMEQPLGLGLGLGQAPRAGVVAGAGAAARVVGGGRPTSARPMSARPTSARPTSAMPRGRIGSPTRGLAESGGGLGVGMHVILEQSEGTVGEDC